MNRATPILLILLLALVLAPTAQAAWTTSVSVPESFRPERSVTFAYTATSSSSLDAPLRWRVTLYTCQDTDADGWCEPTDANRVDHGERVLNTLGGNSQTANWGVTLASPEGAYQYHFHTACLDNPCTGVAPGGAHNRTGTFQLAYTNTWTREIVTANPTSAGSTQAVSYRLTSTSVDDPDLSGAAELFSTPAGGSEESLGAKTLTAPANAVTTLTWSDVAFPTIGTQLLRVADSTAATDATLSVTARGVHLHATQPRAEYAAGARFSLYFALEGHGADPDPAGLADVDVQLTIRNGSYVVHAATLRTDAAGLAYANVTTAADHDALTWTARAAGTWLGIPYDLERTGQVNLTKSGGADEDLAAIRADLDELQLKGVHLDELGSRHLFLTSARAAGAVALVILLVLLVIYVAIRV